MPKIPASTISAPTISALDTPPPAPQSETAAALELASLLCSRLCHDMLSPIGAMSNGLELLADEKDPVMRQRCLELLEHSARSSANKLKFFRLAFGAAGGFGEMVSVAEPRAVIEALATARDRVTINWTFAADTLPKAAVKVLLNLAAIGLESLVRGGTLDVAAEIRGDATEIAVRAAGPRLAFDTAIGRALEGHGELSSRTAPATMLARMAADLGGGLQYALSDEALVMGAVLPLK